MSLKQAKAIINRDVGFTLAQKRVLRQALDSLTAGVSEGPGTGITAATGEWARWTISESNGIIKSELIADFNGLHGSAADLDIIGKTGAANCHWGRYRKDEMGTIIHGIITCLVVPVGGAGVDDIDFYSATVGTGTEDTLITALTETPILTAGGAWTLGLQRPTTGVPTEGDYFYFTNGEAAAAGDFTAGRFRVELWGTA